jgi:hypothetical protein
MNGRTLGGGGIQEIVMHVLGEVASVTTPERVRETPIITPERSFLGSVHEPPAPCVVSPINSLNMQGGCLEIPDRLLGRKRKAASEVLAHVLPIYESLPDPSDFKVIAKREVFR